LRNVSDASRGACFQDFDLRAILYAFVDIPDPPDARIASQARCISFADRLSICGISRDSASATYPLDISIFGAVLSHANGPQDARDGIKEFVEAVFRRLFVSHMLR
jgi:hypothetical protein